MRENGTRTGYGSIQQRSERRSTAIDLFAGCGGLSSGLRAAGFDVLAAIEKDADAAATFNANHPDVQLYETDIRLVSPKRLLRELKLPKGETIDLIAGCPPCQGFTRLTESMGRPDRRNGLVRQFLRFVRAIRPKVCMLFDEYERLVEAARRDPQVYLVVLLGGEAGLRCGEMMALEWTDVDLSKRQLCVDRNGRGT